MKRSKRLYSQDFREYGLSDEQLERLHARLLEALLFFDDLCRKNNIKYSLCGGTLLGAVRHSGFIPWDDDVDLMMTRSEYRKFRAAFAEADDIRYRLSEPGDDGYYNKMPKIFIRNTIYDDIVTAGVKGPHEAFVDIFIIENIPKSKLVRRMRGILYFIAHRGSSVCIDYRFPSPPIIEKSESDGEVRRHYASRRRMGWVFDHFGGMERWLRLCERLAAYNKKTGLLGITAGVSYNFEVLPAKVYTETTTIKFCGREVMALKDTDTYLTKRYGSNYMQIPPKEKREVHSAYRVKL